MAIELSLTALAPALRDRGQLKALLADTTFVGIDFGTSTTVVSYAALKDEGAPVTTEVVPIPQDLPDGRVYTSHLVPTAVAWCGNRLLVGEGARQLRGRLTQGRNIWTSFKMELGVDIGPRFFNSELTTGHPVATIQTSKDVAAVFFRFLMQEIEAFTAREGLPSNVAWSVSIPASFESNQRSDLLEALERAGIELQGHGLIDEPNAAFLSYLAEASRNTLGSFRVDSDAPLHVLVFDFGAGTCDISILEIGQTEAGIGSRNLAISRFVALGGDDIDRQIARQVLLPQLLQQNSMSVEDLTLADLDKRVIPQLMGAAEELKLAACKRVATQRVGQRLPPLARSSETVTLPARLQLRAARRDLGFEKPAMTFSQLDEVLKPFISEEPGFGDLAGEAGRSVFEPIMSAMAKAGLRNEQLDLVLLIGGSAENPYVQAALRNYFGRVDLEIPEDLRAHVSCGAALNSLMANGLGLALIRPITSEPIVVVTRDGHLQTVLPAGTSIPCDPVFVEGLAVASEAQEQVQVPICIGNEKKLLGLLNVRAERDGGFASNTPVTLRCELSEDKVLTVSAQVGDQLAVSVVTNPYANCELTTEERELLRAERLANVSAAENGGRPTAEVLVALADACVEAGKFLRAAETLETAAGLKGIPEVETRLACLYERAGRIKASAEWARRAYAKSRSPVSAFNLALEEFRQGRMDDYERLLKESIGMDPDAAYALVALGRRLLDTDPDTARRLLRRACDLYQQEMRTGDLDEDDYPRLVSAAEALKLNALAAEARRRLAALQKNKHFDYEQLVARTDMASTKRE